MTLLSERLSAPGRILIANAPEGLEAVLLPEVVAARAAAGQSASLLHVARDDARQSRLAEALRFFAPNVEVLKLPAWDCLPYDRVGPHRDILAARLDTLSRLAEPEASSRPRIVISTVAALLQRVPPRGALEGRVLRAAPGDRIGQETLTEYFGRNGYLRTGTVDEPGEYALRGGIVDVFPPGEEQPLRLDFFGDELESLRGFDPLSQRTTGPRDSLVLKPVSEVILDPDSIERFRSGYREAFGGVGDDPLYEAVTAGRVHPGMEHWLPLFYGGLETILDYLPEGPVTLDHQAEEVRDVRLETIHEFHEARETVKAAETGGWPYRALPPDRLYLDAEEWRNRLAERPGGLFSPFAAPEEGASVLDAGGRGPHDFAEARTASDGRLYEAVGRFAAAETEAGRRVLIAGYTTGSLDRLKTLLREEGLEGLSDVASRAELDTLPPGRVGAAVLGLERGFGGAGLTVVGEQDILGERLARPAARRPRPENFLTEVSTLQTGDLVVHADHGIGRYEGLEAIDVGGAPHDCLRLIYHGGDKLYLPVENIEVLSRFGSEDASVELDRLGQGGWQARKARVKARIKSIADELIKVAAQRQLKSGEVMTRPEGLYDEFCARFPYPETEDQLRAIEETLEDLGSGRPMDRLVCGDVGFGKTEVALRAAFLAVMAGHQVAVVVPTTLLARQHTRSFKERFAGLPVRVAQISRLVSAKEAQQVKEDLKSGRIEIVVGTHALLSKSVRFSDLGLLIVDEEQHFGVKQKERLKQLRRDVHVLTLTATPIPRTLQLALSGVKEMSLIATPPVDRLAVRTFVLPYDPVIVREAILREHHRGGQVFYVCPRIEHLDELEERLRKLVPEIKIGVAHGRLPPAQLEDVMTGFVDRRFDLLLCTNIIESGLDIPSANTMIVHRADMFGLAQLYQLRGRIGRAKLRAYAYLTLRPGRLLTAGAEKRLEVMQTLDTLGAGFSLASHDLDIRGAGNLLGEEQSGHIREVGIELYQQMLEEAVAAARRGDLAAEEAAAESWTPQISLGTPVLIPEAYVADLNVRLGLYRRLSTLVDPVEIEGFAAELIDRFGPLPDEVENLLHIMAIKRLCRDAGVDKLDAGPKGAVVAFREERMTNPEALIRFVQREADFARLRPDSRLVYQQNWEDPKARLAGVRSLLGDLAGLAAKAA